jgi:hypothetical protein
MVNFHRWEDKEGKIDSFDCNRHYFCVIMLNPYIAVPTESVCTESIEAMLMLCVGDVYLLDECACSTCEDIMRGKILTIPNRLGCFLPCHCKYSCCCCCCCCCCCRGLFYQVIIRCYEKILRRLHCDYAGSHHIAPLDPGSSSKPRPLASQALQVQYKPISRASRVKV